MLYNTFIINRKTLSVLFIGAFFTFIIGCDNGNKESESKINQEIMAVHDDIMPKMGEVNRLKRRLSEFKDGVPEDNAEMKDSLINAILLLSKMEDNMNDWMGNYKYPNPDATHEQMLTYLAGQRDTVKQLSNDIYLSIGIANGFLKNTAKDSTNK
jgi:hypothetical protein